MAFAEQAPTESETGVVACYALSLRRKRSAARPKKRNISRPKDDVKRRCTSFVKVGDCIIFASFEIMDLFSGLEVD